MTARGFTLVEVLIWAGLVGIITFSALTLLNQSTRAYLFGAARVETQQAARGELEPILRTVRNASFVLDAETHGFEVMDTDGMRVRFSNARATFDYVGGHGESLAVLLANPTLIKAITITLGPFQATAALRNAYGTMVRDPEACSRGTYVPGGYNLFCP